MEITETVLICATSTPKAIKMLREIDAFFPANAVRERNQTRIVIERLELVAISGLRIGLLRSYAFSSKNSVLATDTNVDGLKTILGRRDLLSRYNIMKWARFKENMQGLAKDWRSRNDKASGLT